MVVQDNRLLLRQRNTMIPPCQPLPYLDTGWAVVEGYIFLPSQKHFFADYHPIYFVSWSKSMFESVCLIADSGWQMMCGRSRVSERTNKRGSRIKKHRHWLALEIVREIEWENGCVCLRERERERENVWEKEENQGKKYCLFLHR